MGPASRGREGPVLCWCKLASRGCRELGHGAELRGSGILQSMLRSIVLGPRGSLHSWSHSKPRVPQSSARCRFLVHRCDNHSCCLSPALMILGIGSLGLNCQAETTAGPVARAPFADRHRAANARTAARGDSHPGWQTPLVLSLPGSSTSGSATAVFTFEPLQQQVKQRFRANRSLCCWQ